MKRFYSLILKEQSKLKGTLEPTVVVKRKKIKRRTKEQILIDRHNEKKAFLRKAVKKQKDFLNHNFQQKNISSSISISIKNIPAENPALSRLSALTHLVRLFSLQSPVR